jgi:hypothetical protein
MELAVDEVISTSIGGKILIGKHQKYSEINLSLCLGWNLGFCSQRLATNYLTQRTESQILVKDLYSTKTGG